MCQKSGATVIVHTSKEYGDLRYRTNNTEAEKKTATT
jgi:hypothetical protein